jgi:hypothetical protein
MESLFSGPMKGRNPEIDASVLEYFKDYEITREALMSKAKECARNSNIPVKASCGWYGRIMMSESLS